MEENCNPLLLVVVVGKGNGPAYCGGRGSRLAGCWCGGAARSLVAQGRREKEGEKGEGGMTALVSI